MFAEQGDLSAKPYIELRVKETFVLPFFSLITKQEKHGGNNTKNGFKFPWEVDSN